MYVIEERDEQGWYVVKVSDSAERAILEARNLESDLAVRVVYTPKSEVIYFRGKS